MLSLFRLSLNKIIKKLKYVIIMKIINLFFIYLIFVNMKLLINNNICIAFSIYGKYVL